MSNQKKLTVPIKGMHCQSCEMLIESRLKEVEGVTKTIVSHRRNTAEIFFQNNEPDSGAVKAAIAKAGYSVGLEKNKGFLSKSLNDYKELGMAFLFLIGLYFMLKGLGLTSINLNPSPESLTVWFVLLVGLTAGVSTCMALIGGLVLGLSVKHNEKHPEATAMQKFRPHLFFNLGRLISYTILGGVLGLIGSTIQLSSLALGILTILVGLVMLVMGLQLIEIFPWANKFKLTLPKGLGRALGVGENKKEYSHTNSMILGALTFFLPCGFTQAMQVFAVSTSNFFLGALVMGLFAIGTLPGLLSIGGLASVVKGSLARKFFKFAGLAVIAFSIFNISNGLGLTGWNTAFGQTNNINLNDPNVTLENNVQVVKMKELANGYSPNSFTIKKGIKVKWVIDAQAPFSCAASLVLPKFNIRKNLIKGENIIEFTPTETGRIPFSCSMGMYTGVFNVVDDGPQSNSGLINAAEAADKPALAAANNNAASGGGCGCGGGNANIKPDATATLPQVQDKIQVINTVYTANNYLQPNSFKVKAGTKVKFTIDVKDDGQGCGYAIMIPGLYNNATPLQAGVPITMEFTPTTPGSYDITCGMQMITYGAIVVE